SAGGRSRPFRDGCRDPPRVSAGRHLRSCPTDPHLAVLDHADIISRGGIVFCVVAAAARAAIGATRNRDATVGNGLVSDCAAHGRSLPATAALGAPPPYLPV